MHKFLLFLISSVFFFFVGCGSGATAPSLALSGCSVDSQTTNTVTVATVPHTKASIPMLGILVSYNNVQITSSDSIWSHKLFGYNEHELNHYYKEVSNNQFHFVQATESNGTHNDGIVSIHLNKDHPNSSNLSNFYLDLKNALVNLNSYVDFSNYDSDANGKITPDELLLTFIIAGFEDAYENHGHVTNGVWAHQYCMTESTNSPTLDSVSLMGCQNGGNFALFGERHDISDSHDATIGIIAHELGHATFNLPDLYNMTQSKGGIGNFGLMGAGAWSYTVSDTYPGATPVHFSAWSKVYNKWITPTVHQGFVTLNETFSAGYNIEKISVNSNCYYLLENRNNSGYDRGLYSLGGNFQGGIAIWKIDNTKLTDSHFEHNDVNGDTQNKGVDLVEAKPSNIDSSAGSGHEFVLFYKGNVDSYEAKIANISQRGSSMSLNIN